MQFIDGVNVLVFLHLIALALHLAENMTRALVSTKGIAQHAQSHLDAVLRHGNLQCSHALFACKANDRDTIQDC